jgi:chemotaxis protein methyltransferase CheR
MSCLDFQLQHPSFRFQIVATDVDTNVLASAESGIFRESTVHRLKQSHPTLFKRHFTPSHQGAFQVDEAVRRSIRFAQHNLMNSPAAFMPQNIIFLRNVLIYFRESEQNKIISSIADYMLPGAILVLGESESLNSLDAPLQFVGPQIYRRTP